MASPLELFQKNIIGSKGTIHDFIPFISSKGDFARVSGISAILASWNNILLTPIRSYTHNPEYGSELYKYAFEPADESTIRSIQNEIEYRISLFDDRAKINSIEVSFFKDGHGFIVDITFSYDGETDSLSLSIDGNNYLNFT